MYALLCESLAKAHRDMYDWIFQSNFCPNAACLDMTKIVHASALALPVCLRNTLQRLPCRISSNHGGNSDCMFGESALQPALIRQFDAVDLGSFSGAS